MENRRIPDGLIPRLLAIAMVICATATALAAGAPGLDATTQEKSQEGPSRGGKLPAFAAATSSSMAPTSLSGSFVVFDPSVGGDVCFTPEATQTLCFRAEAFVDPFNAVQSLWLRFPASWTVTDAWVQGSPPCTLGDWGAFTWSLPTCGCEIKIDRALVPFISGGECTAQYCFQVVTGPSTPEATVSWYWLGTGDPILGGPGPYRPCSDDFYTPSGQASCDEASQPRATVGLCLPPGLHLAPEVATASGCVGAPLVHTFTLYNRTGAAGTFDLSYSIVEGHGTVSGPETVTVASGADGTFDLTLTQTACALPGGETVTAQVEATGNGYSDQATATNETISHRQEMETVPGSSPPWAGTGYPDDGCTARNAAGDWVTYIIGDGYTMVGLWGYNHATNTWFQTGATATPPGRAYAEWALDATTNLCYLTGGFDFSSARNDAYRYDPVANVFTTLGSFGTGRMNHSSWVGTIDGVRFLCVGGGMNSSFQPTPSTQCYDLSQAAPGGWDPENAQLGTLPTPNCCGADGVLHAPSGDQLWYVGGGNYLDPTFLPTDRAFYWDDATNGWIEVRPTGVPLMFAEGDFLDGAFYQLGGIVAVPGLTPTGTAVRGSFDGSGWVWTTLPDMSNARIYTVVGATEDNVWSVDGNGSTATAYVERLAPCPSCTDLSVANVDSPDPAAVGQPLTYALTVSNAGTAEATAVHVVDTLPGGVAYVGAAGAGWTCGEAGGVVTCDLPSLASSATAGAIEIVVTPTAAGTIINLATVSAAQLDVDLADNTATAETTVVVPPEELFSDGFETGDLSKWSSCSGCP